MFVAKGLKADPDNAGWVLGWAVVRNSPWHLAGVYATKEVAEMKVLEFGDTYQVRYGAHRLDSDDFVSGMHSQ
ncbi:TPA: hypothetical protein ACPZQN_003874 [Yersinia enterocolitica]|uniref:hypothetical protein n=1 Tax=Yersinia TaxID=629 RepID=UPI0028B3AEFA|nr:hypothetical protein [Yersinia enterocolitica]HDL8228739.1 hypothetical protein [Yersinia enterocolitica]